MNRSNRKKKKKKGGGPTGKEHTMSSNNHRPKERMGGNQDVTGSSSFIFSFSSGSSQLSSTVARTLLTYSFIFSLYNCAASALAGLLGLGSCSSDWMEVKIAATS